MCSYFLRSDTRKVNFGSSLRWPIYIVKSRDKTMLFCNTLYQGSPKVSCRYRNFTKAALRFLVDTETLPKRYDRVKYRGEWKNCDNFHTKDDFRNWCNCPFVACTEPQECTPVSGFFYRFLLTNVNVEDIDRSDCACKYLYEKD